MVYKKYIKRGNKIHGPYYYKSYRDENGKTKSRYLKNYKPSWKNKNPFIIFLAILIILGFIFGLYLGVDDNFPKFTKLVSNITSPLLKITGFVSFNPSDNRTIGYEYLNSSGDVVSYADATVVHTWNSQDDYFFNKSSGIQFTNHFQEYWTHNIFCAGYKDPAEGWKYDCNDALPFNWNIKTDNLTYVNITGYRDKIILGRTVRLGLRYHLKLNDKNLSVQLSIKHLSGENVPYDVGFAWVVNDIKINNDTLGDSIFLNHSNEDLDGSTSQFDLNNITDTLTFRNMNESYYMLIDKSFVRLDWDNNLNYRVKIENVSGQDNARVSLGINAGNLSVGQEKHTTLYWKDPLAFGNTATGKTADLWDIPMTWNHIFACEDEQILIVGIAIDSEPTVIVSTITYDGISLSKIVGNTSSDNEIRGEMWNLTSPPCGSSKVVNVTFTADSAEEAAGVSTVYSGVKTINLSSLSTASQATTTADSTLDVPAVADQWVVDVLAYDNDPITGVQGDNQTLRGQIDQDVVSVGTSDGNSTDGTVTMSWDLPGDEWVMIGVALIPASVVKWNQSSLDMGESINNITSTLEISSERANTNVKVDCSGNCTEITTNWTTHNMSDGQIEQVLITCSNETEGVFNATFNVTSDEDTSSNLLNVTCDIYTYGTLDVNITLPINNSVYYQNETNLIINARVTCSGTGNAKCPVSALVRYNASSSTPDTAINATEGAIPFYISAWDLSSAIYDNVNILPVQDTGSSDLFFKSDGTKLYGIGNTGNLFYQYSCSDAWNLSSCSYDNVNISTQDTTSQGLFFKSDGTKLYEVGSGGDKFYQYTCSDAWNLSSCSYDNVNISTQDTITTDLFFKPDGTRLYETGSNGELIYQSTCSDAWNLSSCSYDNVNIPTQDTNPTDLFFKPDGTKLYEMGSNGIKFYQYTCSDAWNLNSCSYDNVNIPTQAWWPRGLFFKPDGTKLYELDLIGGVRIYQSSLGGNLKSTTLNQGESWNVTWTLSVTSSSIENYLIDVLFNSSYGNTTIPDNDTEDRLVKLNEYGTLDVNITLPINNSVYYQNETNLTINASVTCQGITNAKCGTVYALARYNASSSTPDTAISITEGASPFYGILNYTGNYTYDNWNFGVASQDTSPRGIAFNGTYFWVVGENTNRVYRYLANGTYDNWNFDVAGQDTLPEGIAFNGTYFWVAGYENTRVYRYLANGTYDNWNFSIAGQDIALEGITFNGTYFWVVGENTNRVYRYLANGTYDNWNFSIASPDAFQKDITFNGTYFWVVGDNTDTVYRYLANGTYDNWNFSIAGQDIALEGIVFNGTYFWVVGDNTNRVYRYAEKVISQNPETSSETLEQGESWNVSWTLNVTTSSTENYLLDVNFTSSYGNTNVPDNDTEDRTVKLNPSGVDETPPTVNLISPTNYQNLSSLSVDFNCTMTDTGDGLKNSTLYGNWSGWHANETQTITGSSNSTNFTKTLSDGNYIWNCYVCDQADNCAFDSANYTFTVDTIAPTVNLVAPENNSEWNSSSTVNFTYNVSDTNSIENCSLIINGSINQTNSSITKDTNQTFNQTLADGNYNWSVNCTDSFNNIGASGTYNLTVNISVSISISLSPKLGQQINWTLASLPIYNQSAEGNNNTGITEYYVNISAEGTSVDLYVKANDDLTTASLDILGLGNETYSYNSTNSSVPSDNKYSLTINYLDNKIGENLDDGAVVYLKFFLNAPSGQPAGTYNNTLSFKGVPNGQTP